MEDDSWVSAAAQANAWKGWCHVDAPAVANADSDAMRRLRLQRLVKDAYAKAWAGKYIKGFKPLAVFSDSSGFTLGHNASRTYINARVLHKACISSSDIAFAVMGGATMGQIAAAVANSPYWYDFVVISCFLNGPLHADASIQVRWAKQLANALRRMSNNAVIYMGGSGDLYGKRYG